MSGFVTISRRLFTHALWTKRREFSEAEAWIDLIQSAQWQPCKQLVKGKMLEVGRGELLASLRYLQERWGWGSPNRVSRYLEMLEKENMICIKNETVTQRITICKYDTYNTPRNTDGTDTEHKRDTDGTDTEQTRNKDNNINKNNKINKETTPMAQAGGFDFEKLAEKVGPVCAKLIIEGSVGQMLDNPKKRQFVKWANHKFTRGQEISTPTVLFELVKKFQATEIELLTESVSESIGGDYARLVISKPKAGAESPVLPNYWKTGIEAELKLTPEQTIRYHQQLIALGWYKTTEQGQPYWNRPQKNGSRTGETTLAGAIKA